MMLYELKGSNVVCPYDNVFPFQKFIVFHLFQIMKNINGSIPSIQDIRNIQKGRPLRMSQLKWFNLKCKIQNKIGLSYLGGLSVSLIQTTYI